MSRTHRRQNGRNKNWKNFDTREEFESLQAEYKSLSWCGTYISQWNGREYKYKWHHREVVEYRDYDHYIAANVARYHGDRGWWGSGVPSAFVNKFCERPMRAQHKQQIRRAWDNDSWDELVLQPFVHDAGWLYW